MKDDEIERLAKLLWEQENPSKPWLTPTSRSVLGQDVVTGASEEDRERYRSRVRNGER